MFESKLREISRNVFHNKNIEEYFILTHKKHKREMYFKVGDKKALYFAKPKFNSKKKAIIFFLLKWGILQPFLKKIELSGEIGEVVFVGGQIKGFNLRKKIANSFFHTQRTKGKFVKDKETQIKIAKRGFAPNILELDKKNYFSREELFHPFMGNISLAFDRLFEFYKKNKIKKIKTTEIKNKIKKYFKKDKINETLFNQALEKIGEIDYYLFTKIHGEFAKEQCLTKNKKIFFVDWDVREGLITEDLVSFFRLDDEYFNKKEFRILLKKYPDHVKNNLRAYLLLTELLKNYNGIKDIDLQKRRIANLLKV